MNIRYISNYFILYKSSIKCNYFQKRYKHTNKKIEHNIQSIPIKDYKYQKLKYKINNDILSNTTTSKFDYIKKSIPVIIDALFLKNK
jgi:hypothetical protein